MIKSAAEEAAIAVVVVVDIFLCTTTELLFSVYDFSIHG